MMASTLPLVTLATLASSLETTLYKYHGNHDKNTSSGILLYINGKFTNEKIEIISPVWKFCSQPPPPLMSISKSMSINKADLVVSVGSFISSSMG